MSAVGAPEGLGHAMAAAPLGGEESGRRGGRLAGVKPEGEGGTHRLTLLSLVLLSLALHGIPLHPDSGYSVSTLHRWARLCTEQTTSSDLCIRTVGRRLLVRHRVPMAIAMSLYAVCRACIHECTQCTPTVLWLLSIMKSCIFLSLQHTPHHVHKWHRKHAYPWILPRRSVPGCQPWHVC